MAVSPARKAAFDILLRVGRGQAHSDDLLRGKAVSALAVPDRNLTTSLVLGVLRWQILLDQRIRPLLSRPNAKLDPEVLIALRLGAFQILHLERIPARAAIDESVELTKQAGHRFASGMVNAVLRKLAAGRREVDGGTSGGALENRRPVNQGLVSQGSVDQGWVGRGFSPDINHPSETRALAPEVWSAYPEWMVARWNAAFGADTACAICSHGQYQPVLTLRIPDSRVEDELREAGLSIEPGALLTCARIAISGDITATKAFREGRIRIQDEGSQLIAEIAGQGSAILDCCAAPGGKTLILAERNPDAHIVACEASAQRLAALRERVAEYGNRVECRLADATVLEYDAAFDLVLADVPCSGTGTLGRNPEIRHRLQPADFARQAERQRLILSSALQAVRPGGRVVYSTCSLEPEENEQVIAAVLAENPSVQILPLQSRIEEMRSAHILTESGAQKLLDCATREGYLRLFPGAFGTDGFFVAMLRREPRET